MHKFIIVGHPQSGYEEVGRLLNDCGMKNARSSHRTNLSPHEIAATICSANGVLPTAEPESEGAVQIGTAAIWQGLALDLVLGNIDQKFWGWADPTSLCLLDYWDNLDLNFKFIFVYQHPQTTFNNDHGTPICATQTIERRIANWCAFNTALLDFYYRNRQKCLLVHQEQVELSDHIYLQQLRTQLNAPLAGSREPQSLRIEQLNDPGQESPPAQTSTGDLANSSKALEQFLLGALIDQHPQAHQLYEELQSAADLPLAKPSNETSVLDAWGALAEQKEHLAHLEGKLVDAKTAIAASVTAQQENKLLLAQLQDVQEELERHHRQRRKHKRALAQTIEELNELRESERELRRCSEAYRAVTRRIFYQFGVTIADNSRSMRGWLSMPRALMRVAKKRRREKRALA
jgi:hypothetical protein